MSVALQTLLTQLQGLVTQGVLAPIDHHFAAFIARHEDSPEVVLAAAVASHALGQQSSCVALGQRCDSGEAIPGSGIATPALEHWCRSLACSSAVGLPGESAPLVLDGDKLYLSRFYRGEADIAAGLRARATAIDIDETWLGERLDHYFGVAGEQPDWQKLAAAIALSRRFALITGGPGTGKTTTVVKILALLLEQEQEQEKPLEQQAAGRDPLRICMAAPTGKAAARLSQSIVDTLQGDTAIDPQLAERLPTEVSTIHRLLRPLPNSARFRHNADNPLHCDVLLVDEASMIDIGLMAHLLAALKPATRVILLGDRNQLPSVGVGQVVHDLCAELGPGGSEHVLPYSDRQRRYLERVCGFGLGSWVREQQQSSIGDCIAVLQHSYRFGANSGIGRLAKIVNTGDAAAAAEFMEQAGAGELVDVNSLSPSAAAGEWLQQLARPWLALQRQFEDVNIPIPQKLQLLEQYQILCALREGVGSVRHINQTIEHRVARALMEIRTEARAETRTETLQGYYAGRPIMITENNYSLQLYNGDSGVILRDSQGQLAAWFEGADGDPRRFAISRLPAHECSYAISVHKSQGSEYRHVALVLPPSAPRELAPLVSRELIYTAVTRAREHLTLACTAEVLCAGLQRRVCRETGLVGRLQEFDREV